MPNVEIVAQEPTLDDVLTELDTVKENQELIKEQLAEVIERLTNMGLERGYYERD